jgi:hypothetical protein
MLGIINKLKSHPAGSNFVKMASNAEMTASHEYIDLSIIENNICNGTLIYVIIRFLFINESLAGRHQKDLAIFLLLAQ